MAEVLRSAVGHRDPANEVVRLVNRLRAAHGHGPLRKAPRLRRSALSRAGYLERRHVFSHAGWFAAIRRTGYVRWKSSHVGENIAEGFDTAEAVVAAWMASPPHRENILRPTFKAIGVGRVDDTWVQHFGGR